MKKREERYVTSEAKTTWSVGIETIMWLTILDDVLKMIFPLHRACEVGLSFVMTQAKTV